MRVLLLIITMLMANTSTFSQIKFKKEFKNIKHFYLSDTEFVFVSFELKSQNTIIKIYDESLKEIKTIKTSYKNISQISNVSKHLFNSDDKIEICFSTHIDNNSKLYIINEDGKILFSKEKCSLATIISALEYTYMALGSSENSEPKFIYSLSGKYYAGLSSIKGQKGDRGYRGVKGDKGDVGSVISFKKSSEINLSLDSYPNPASEDFIVDYDISDMPYSAYLSFYDYLGSKVLSIAIDKSENQKEIPISYFSSGQYIYRIEGENYISKSKKIQIIK